MKLGLFLWLVMFLGGSFVHSSEVQQLSRDPRVTEISHLVPQLYKDKKNEFSAMAYAIFNSKGILHSEGFGTLGWDRGHEVDPKRSLFRFASISKLLTSAAVARLVQEGVLTLDTPIMSLKKVQFVQYLNRHETKERLEKWGQIKIRHLLSHQAGISKDLPGSRVFWNSESLNDHSYPSFLSFYKGLLKVEFIYPAGKTEGAAKYSNLGMNLLARIVEDTNRAQLSFQGYVKKFIFQPMGMLNSFYDIPQKHRNSLVSGYGTVDPKTGPLKIPDAYFTASYDGSIGVASSVEDMAQFGKELLKASLYRENAIYKSTEAIEEFLTPVDENSFLSPVRVMANGPFWRVRPVTEKETKNLWLGFTGFGYAFDSILLMNPAHDLGIVLAINSSASDSFYFWDAIVESLKKHSPSDTGEKSKELRKIVMENILNSDKNFSFNQPKSEKVSRAMLEKFEGLYYADNLYKGPTAEIKIEENEDKDAYLTFHGRKIYAENVKTGRFRFEKGPDVLFNGEPVVFQFDDMGQVSSVLIANVKDLKYVSKIKK